MSTQSLLLTFYFALIVGLVEGELCAWMSSEHGDRRILNCRAGIIGATLGWLFGVLLPTQPEYAPWFTLHTAIYGGIIYLFIRLLDSRRHMDDVEEAKTLEEEHLGHAA